MIKHFLLFACTFFFFSSALFGQQWIANFNGTANGADEIKAMAVDNEGNVYVTGYAFTTGHSDDFITIKYNADGTQQWMAQYNGPGSGSDVPMAIFVDDKGSVYVTGYSDSLAGDYINNDVTTIKYNTDGVVLWVRRFDGTTQRGDAGNAIKVDASGNVIVAGYETLSHNGISRKDYLTIKYNASGTLQWTATYNAPANEDDLAVGLGLDGLSNIYVTGTSFAGSDPVGEQDYFTIKYNSSGVQQWSARYNGPISEPDYATAIAVDAAGNSYVTGYSNGTDLDFATVKYNTNGVKQWVARHDGKAHGSDLAFAIALDNAGNVYVTGEDMQVIYNTDFRTIKYNSSGVKQWSRRYNGPANDNDEAFAIAVDGPGNVYVTGSINNVSPSKDIATVKYDASGAKKWVRKFNGTGHNDDVGNAIGVDGNGNVYVAGSSTGEESNLDFVTIKYNSSGNKMIPGKEPDEVPAAVTLFQNYPNPFSNSTVIDYYLPEQTDVTMIISDITGRVLREIRNENQVSGKHSIEVSGEDLNSGYYFYTMRTNAFTATKRMVFMR